MSSGLGRVINKGSMEASTSSPTIRVEIYNQTYNIRSDGDTEYIIQLAEFVDSRMREISSGTLTVDSLKVAILAALHIADDEEAPILDLVLAVADNVSFIVYKLLTTTLFGIAYNKVAAGRAAAPAEG